MTTPGRTSSPAAHPCPGGGKSWTVDIAGKPICPRCRRALSTVAGKGKTLRDVPKVPPHDKPHGKPVDRTRRR